MSTTAPPPHSEHPRELQRETHRGRQDLLAALAVVVGIPFAAAGAGVAGRYLTKTGLGRAALLGLLALAVGLVLIVFAWTVFWRAAHGWRRLWFLPAVVGSLLLMSSVTLGTMLAWAPRTELGAQIPADVGLAYSDVSFRTGDGVSLSGWWIPSRTRAAVVTIPGSGSTRSATLGQAAALAQHGYGVLLLDPRGQGRSGGHAMDAGWWGDRDVTAAVAFAQQRPGVDRGRVGLLGLSMGGEEAIGAAAAAGVPAVVAEGATARTAADKSGFLPGGVAGTVQRALDQLTYATADLLSPAPQPGPLYRSVVRARSTAFLFIAGDVADEPQAVAYLRSAAPDRVQTWVIPGAPHTHALATAPREWTVRVTAFFDRALRGKQRPQ